MLHDFGLTFGELTNKARFGEASRELVSIHHYQITCRPAAMTILLSGEPTR